MAAKKTRIESVRIERAVDESGDSSYLGEYANWPKAEWRFTLNRATGQMLDFTGDDTAILAEVWTDYNGRGEYRWIGGFQHSGRAKDWAHVSERNICTAYLREKLRGGFAKFKINPDPAAHPRIYWLDLLYACRDAYRLETLSRGDWCYLGVIAKAEIRTPSGVLQTIRSSGLWGVESDSGADYLAEIEAEQLEELRGELSALGIGARAIAYAFRNVEHAED